MIIVTGASGQLGRAIIQSLVTLLPADRIGATCRDPAKAADLASLGVRLRRADFAEPASLAHGFEGASQVLIVSSNARASGGDPLAQHQAAIDAARAASARRIVYTSHMAASPASAFPPMWDHAATEAMLAESGLAWTALRHGFYGSAGVFMLGQALQTGLLETAAEGPFSWAAHEDLALAASRILTQETWTQGPTAPLTGPEALDFGALARIAAEVTGRAIRHEVLTDEAMRAKAEARGLPERVAGHMMGLYIAARRGEFATLDPTLEQLTGRPLRRMRDLIAASKPV